MSVEVEVHSFEASSADAGERLDKVAARHLDISRSAAQRLISEGAITVGVGPAHASLKVRGDEVVRAEIPSEDLEAEDIPIDAVYEDDDLLVVDKPAGLVVHPGAGHGSGTLVNALLDRGISGGEDPVRPGVVHRLDRDTSGLMMVAKSEAAYAGLVAMLAAREVGRAYRTIVVGDGLPATGTVDSPVGRDPENPTLMAAGIGKHAVTHFELLGEAASGRERHTMLRVKLETGRTHQIRVHLSAIGYPLYADPLYGKAVPEERLWLHAERLAFTHPVSGEEMQFESGLPGDLKIAASRLGFDRDELG